jgi:uncharacterized protein involved in propanediol utilization
LDAVMGQIAVVSGHFGELIQGRMGDRLALISLPCPSLRVTARHHFATGLQIHPPAHILPARARRFLADLGLGLHGRITLGADMPIGGGAGSSTATLVALARLAGWRGDPLDLARACLRAEGATDPLMLPQAERILWASREGVVLDQMPPLPDFDILGGFLGKPVRTNPEDLDFCDISDLVPRWRAATTLAEFANLTTVSAQRNLHRRGPPDDPTLGLAQRLGALGVVIAHTGTARGLIFARGQIPVDGQACLRANGMASPIMFTHKGHK